MEQDFTVEPVLLAIETVETMAHFKNFGSFLVVGFFFFAKNTDFIFLWIAHRDLIILGSWEVLGSVSKL